ncbi:hypothetical protein [Agromyces sp. M3QZ16-3]|uniref:hypothetical protein n=1 Tax=Agromyces sp. M3QZ16-3 TaxID=3447585 RepID=UPI003F68EED5
MGAPRGPEADSGTFLTMAPTRFDASGIVALEAKPTILWIRGANGVIVITGEGSAPVAGP